MNVGLFFGSFNPIHTGHMVIANYMIEYSDLDQLWFVVSPHNPLKKKSSLLNNHHRFEMVYRAVENDDRFRASDIEFNMPQPSYTIHTLTYLKEKYSKYRFSLIMGADNMATIKKWKNPEEIMADYHIYVYPRPGTCNNELKQHANIHLIAAPLMEMSSSFIRQAIKEGRDIRHFLPGKVWSYLEKMNFYK